MATLIGSRLNDSRRMTTQFYVAGALRKGDEADFSSTEFRCEFADPSFEFGQMESGRQRRASSDGRLASLAVFAMRGVYPYRPMI